MDEIWRDFPAFATGHLRLTLLALGIAVSVSVPLGVLATRHAWLERIVMPVASVVQTIPGLALLAGMVIALGHLGMESIGVVPATIALTAYGVLPILRNTVLGIRELDPAIVEAADGVGMSPNERLRLVELPLALPTIATGVRISTVWVVGTATLSTPVGAPSLGNYIFAGLQTNNTEAVVVGCVAAAVLALALDALVRMFEVGVRRRRAVLRWLSLGGVGALALVVALGSYTRSETTVRIGAKTFSEQYILAELMALRVEEETGQKAQIVSSLGSAVVYEALASGDIDVYVDYSGTLWTNRMKRDDTLERKALLAQLESWLDDQGVQTVGSLGFENAYALAMPAARAKALGVASIADLRDHASRMDIGGDIEFFDRPEWVSIAAAYDLRFAQERSMDASLMYAAAANGDVDVISAFSTDGRLDAMDLRVLADPKGAVPPYDAIILVNAAFADENPDVVAALRTLVGTVDAETMRAWNRAVDEQGAAPSEVAKRWRP